MERIDELISSMGEQEAKAELVELINSSYSLVIWPDSQAYMDEDWFEEEAVLDFEGKFGSSAYFIPTNRIYNVTGGRQGN